MMKKRVGLAALTLLVAALLLAGCAGGSKMQRVEEGYQPSHVTVGEIIVYTQGAAGADASRLRELMVDELESAFREQGIDFVSQRELPSTSVPLNEIVKLTGTVTFQEGASDIVSSTDARLSYDLVRSSDGFLWQEGSAKSTDVSVSQGATTDVTSAMRLTARAAAEDMEKLMP